MLTSPNAAADISAATTLSRTLSSLGMGEASGEGRKGVEPVRARGMKVKWEEEAGEEEAGEECRSAGR